MASQTDVTGIDYALRAVTLEAALRSPGISFCLTPPVGELMSERAILLSDHREALECGTGQALMPPKLRDVVAILTYRLSNNITTHSREEGGARE